VKKARVGYGPMQGARADVTVRNAVTAIKSNSFPPMYRMQFTDERLEWPEPELSVPASSLHLQAFEGLVTTTACRFGGHSGGSHKYHHNIHSCDYDVSRIIFRA
jgi:hypothetical protein